MLNRPEQTVGTPHKLVPESILSTVFKQESSHVCTQCRICAAVSGEIAGLGVPEGMLGPACHPDTTDTQTGLPAGVWYSTC